VSTVIAGLADVDVVVLGDERVGRVMGKLLADQGAQVKTFELEAGEIPGDQLREATRTADVIVDVTPSPVAVRSALGLSPEAVRERGLVYTRFSGFPAGFPEPPEGMSDPLIAAEIGLNRFGGRTDQAEPLPVASTYGAIWGAIMTVTALHRARQDGLGRDLNIPLFAASLTVVGYHLTQVEDERYPNPGSRPHLPNAEIFECGDGRFVQNHGLYPRFVEALCEVMGHPEWVEEAVPGIDRLRDFEDVEMWRGRFAEEFRTRPALEWEELLTRAGSACTMCRSREEWALEAHARDADILRGSPSEPAGSPRVGPPIRLFDRAIPVTQDAPKRTADFWPPPDHPPDPSAPLAGLRVVDFCIVLAGPTCGRILAELGADVIKIDQADRNPTSYSWLEVNRGKRSVLLDLKTAEGRELARKLVGSADVVLENYREGKIDELGLGYRDVAAINPAVVYASMNTFDYGGDWSPRAGWEHLAQAATGMQIARAVAGVPQPVPFPVNDFATGLLGAFGVLTALYARRAHARSVYVTGSLARTATLNQLDYPEFGGAGPGDVEPSRAYPAGDGWVRALHRDGAELNAEEIAAIRELSPREAVRFLRGHGHACAVERSLHDLYDADELTARGFLLAWEHPRWGAVRQGFTNLGSPELPTQARWPARDPGTDTTAVLAGLGLDTGEVEELVARRVAYLEQPLF
jgi:crotonobetainyl-CoA:carnitine CoA-transferase CaiB-like acyl-CoA transferase